MSVIVINYGKMDDAADYAEKGVKHCKKYIEDLEDVKKKLTSRQITNVEDGGSVSSALRLARRKLDEANTFKSTFAEYAKTIDNAKTVAQEKDKAAGRNINTIMNSYLGKRSIFSKASEFFYRQYVCFLDKIGGLGELGKTIKNLIKNVEVTFDGWMETAKNWFKYGNGKYIMNMLDGVKEVALAAIIAIGAITAAVLTGPAWVVALSVAAVVGGLIYLSTKIIDASIINEQNSKAYALAKEGKLTAARYYGDIDGFTELTKRTDYGGETANNVMEGLGTGYKVVQDVSKFVAKTGPTITGIAKLGTAYNAKGEYIVDWKKAWTGYKYKVAHDAGFYNDNYQKQGFSLKAMISPSTPDANINPDKVKLPGFSWKSAFSPTDKIVSSKVVKALSESDSGKIITGAGYAIDAVKTYDNITDITKGIETLVTPNSGIYNETKAFMDTAGNIPIIDAFTGDAWGLFNGIKGLFTSSSASISTEAAAAAAGGWSRF